MRLDIGDLATYRPGTRASDGLHLTPKASADLARETRRAKALLSVPAIVRRLGMSDATAREALADEGKLAEVTGSPSFARQARGLNLIDLALDNPAVLRDLGLDADLLDALSRLTRPVLADRLWWGNFAKSLVFMPMAISFVGASVIWRFVYDYRGAADQQIGVLNALVTFFGLPPQAWITIPFWNSILLMIILVWIQTGFAIMYISTTVSRL